MSDDRRRDKLSYIPAVDEDRAQMLQAIGVPGIDALFDFIPAQVRLDRNLNLPAGLAEQDVVSLCDGLAELNGHNAEFTSFLGAGVYDRYIPAVVESIVSRSEFMTTYTPYQPEVSQGVLQTIYEYQSLICALTGMDVSNASLYDAATAMGEAAIMACGATGRNRVLVSRAVHPHYRQVLSTYTAGLGIEVVEIDYNQGLTDQAKLRDELNSQAACYIVQNPNFFGCIEFLNAIVEDVHAQGALVIVCADPLSLGMLKPPGEYGADVVVGEGQSLGVPVSFGGPFVGIFACKEVHLKRLPGRIVGATVDADSNRAYTLTLQTREQHIRREKATSNICTNQALIALMTTVYLSALGAEGLRHVADLCFQKAHYLQKQICAKDGYELVWNSPFFCEFVIRCPMQIVELNKRLLSKHILGGLDLALYYPELENCMLICATEKRTRNQIDQLVELL